MKVLLGFGCVFFAMVTSKSLQAGEAQKVEIQLGELHVCDPLGGGYGADEAIARTLQYRLLQMSSIQWELGPIYPSSIGDILRGPAIFSVGFGTSGAKPSVEQLLTITREVTTCGEMRIPL